MYNTLIHFFDNFPDILQKPANIDIIKTTYLDFYQDKKDWLVKQYCIFTNAPVISKYSIKPTPRDSEMTSLRMNDDDVLFFSWLTNINYINPEQTKDRNDFWLDISAPKPEEYESHSSTSHSSREITTHLLADDARDV